LHGMWMYLDNGGDALNPRKHTIDVKPGEVVFVNVKADNPGLWAFHYHVL
jgi:FtsP/CotA-like multicopper oxidase with cupredoxin domain